MSPSPVQTRREPPMRWVRLDTGPKNVLGPEAITALTEALAPDPEAPVAVLSGRSDGFCVGLDNAVLAAGPVEREEILTAMGELLLSTLSGPTRVLAVCRGHAVAAGAMLLLIADLRFGSPGGYKIGFTEPALGMPLPELPALLARERLDRRRLHELTVLGQTVDPEEAAAVGFLDGVVAGDRLPVLAEERARALAALSEEAYLGTLESVHGATISRLRALLELQVRRRDEVRRSSGREA